MLRTIIKLPNGTELSSGVGTENAIQSATITKCVNDANELSLGSTCANVLEANILVAVGSNLLLNTKDEIEVFYEDEKGQRTRVGLFTLEKPVRASANNMRITAYDRVSWLDKDLSAWLAGLDGWPYSLYTFAGMVCNACGLTLANSSIPNGSYMVQAFSAQEITGRNLMRWIGEIAGRFCRARSDGNIEFAWYESSGVSITPSGARFYYQNGLSYEDYQVETVEKVQIQLTQDDVGVVWPDVTGEKNTYIISGNYLLTTTSSAALLPIAQALYEHLKGISYTPCKVQIPAGIDIDAGHTVQITDRNGKSFVSYVMTKTQSGQRCTLEGTGSRRRDSTTVVNNQTFRALSGKMLEIQKSVEGFSITASEIKGGAIFHTSEEFYLSVSPSVLAGGSWSAQQPEWTEGLYIWRRSKVTKGDGTVSYTPSENGVCITGNTGAPGTNGLDAVVCRIDSSGGYALKDGSSTVLTARIFVGTEEVDPTGEMNYTWYRSVDDGAYQAFASGKSITVREDSFNNHTDIYFTTEGESQAYGDITVVNGVMTIYALADDPVQNNSILTIT